MTSQSSLGVTFAKFDTMLRGLMQRAFTLFLEGSGGRKKVVFTFLWIIYNLCRTRCPALHLSLIVSTETKIWGDNSVDLRFIVLHAELRSQQGALDVFLSLMTGATLKCKQFSCAKGKKLRSSECPPPFTENETLEGAIKERWHGHVDVVRWRPLHECHHPLYRQELASPPVVRSLV